jgi:hypothetical protein
MNTKEIKITVPEGYEIDKENSSFEKIVFKKKHEVNCWKDLKHVPGVYITDNSCLVPAPSDRVLHHNRNIFLNEKYAKSALALAQISQLLPYYDTNVDWTLTNDKFCISRIGNKIKIERWVGIHHVLAFNSISEADRFLKHNEQLVKDFYML